MSSLLFNPYSVDAPLTACVFTILIEYFPQMCCAPRAPVQYWQRKGGADNLPHENLRRQDRAWWKYICIEKQSYQCAMHVSRLGFRVEGLL